MHQRLLKDHPHIVQHASETTKGEAHPYHVKHASHARTNVIVVHPFLGVVLVEDVALAPPLQRARVAALGEQLQLQPGVGPAPPASIRTRTRKTKNIHTP